ncbi:hypothetical protein Tco_0869582 [Tanacetum coccineum]
MNESEKPEDLCGQIVEMNASKRRIFGTTTSVRLERWLYIRGGALEGLVDYHVEAPPELRTSPLRQVEREKHEYPNCAIREKEVEDQ